MRLSIECQMACSSKANWHGFSRINGLIQNRILDALWRPISGSGQILCPNPLALRNLLPLIWRFLPFFTEFAAFSSWATVDLVLDLEEDPRTLF